MTAATDRRIGRYRLEQVIGTGGFATVHRAVDERLGDTVAVKVLADNHCLNPDMRERFITEGRVLRRIDSPHVVRVHDIGETPQQQPFLVLEHADRGTLAQRVDGLRAGGWTPGPDDVRAVARSMAAAVGAVHRADIVHRDLSPGNVLLRSTVAPSDDAGSAVIASDERLLLADLGLCKDLAVHSGLTVSGGTEGFRPPEQRAGPARVDARADLWALSALLVWLCTGRPPDDRPSKAVLAGTGLPARLGAALATSLADDPRRRHPDVAAWLRDIEAALAPAAPPAERIPRGDDGHAPTRRGPTRRHAVLRLAVALLAGALLGAGALFAIQARMTDAPETTVTALDDGHVEVGQQVGDARVALIGPATVAVDQVATFIAATRGLESWVWLMPDGTVSPDAPQVRLRTRSAGTARIALLGTTGSGDRLEVVHELRVTDR
jgi:hypothetical protein